MTTNLLDQLKPAEKKVGKIIRENLHADIPLFAKLAERNKTDKTHTDKSTIKQIYCTIFTLFVE